MKRIALVVCLIFCSIVKPQEKDFTVKHEVLFAYCPQQFHSALKDAVAYLERTKSVPTKPGKIEETINHVLAKFKVYSSAKPEDVQKLISLIPFNCGVERFLEASNSSEFKTLSPLYEAMNTIIVFALARKYNSEFDIANGWFWSVNWGKRPRKAIDQLDDYFSRLVFPDTFGEGTLAERKFLSKCYRLFLMPQSREETLVIVDKVFDLIAHNSEFSHTMACFKVRPSLMPFGDNIDETFVGWNGESIKISSKAYLPVINLYLEKGKAKAETAVRILRDELKEVKGSGIAPRFSLEIVKNWIYYAQGFGTPKKNPRSQAFLDEKSNWALFNTDFLSGKTVDDYYLSVC